MFETRLEYLWQREDTWFTNRPVSNVKFCAHSNVQNNYFFLFASKKKREKEEENKIINPINAIFGIILLFIENDGHVTTHVTNFSTSRHLISCCHI